VMIELIDFFYQWRRIVHAAVVQVGGGSGYKTLQLL
jgi:hypothetical protein